MSPLTLLRDAEVYAPQHLGRRDLLLGGGSILAMEPKLGELRLHDCEVVHLNGARVIPGLIDAHVHLTGGGGESGPGSRVPPVLFGALARAGITSVVGVLGTDGTTRSVANLVASALGLRQQGLSAWCWTGSYEVPPITLTGSVRGDLTFVDPVIGVGEVALSDHRSSQPTFDELARLAADCHVGALLSGKAGVLHLHLGDGVRGLDLVRQILDRTELPASVFQPTHVNRKTRLFGEALELARRGCPIDLTAFPVEDGEDALSAPDALERYLQSDAPKHLVTVSSDGGGCLPTFDAHGRLVTMDVGRPAAVLETLQTLLARGQPLEKVLPAFTSNVAQVLRLPNKGVVKVGADADLIVLDGSSQVHEVLARGRFVVRGGALTVNGTFEPSSTRSTPS